jgi:hypothetical protein
LWPSAIRASFAAAAGVSCRAGFGVGFLLGGFEVGGAGAGVVGVGVVGVGGFVTPVVGCPTVIVIAAIGLSAM